MRIALACCSVRTSLLVPALLTASLASSALAEDPSCVADVDNDGSVGASDLAAVLAAWGTVAGAGSPLDINGDGFVAGADLTAVLVGWSSGLQCDAGGLDWATVLEQAPDPAVVLDPALRKAIVATGLPWRVRDNGTDIEMLLVPPGEFDMGCSPALNPFFGCVQVEENPVHHVTLNSPFYIGRYEVTQSQWTAIAGSNPSTNQGVDFPDAADRPVETVSWNMVADLLSTTGLRLPTEAEWEYAYRAGTQTAYHAMPGQPSGTNDDQLLATIAWRNTNSGAQSHVVGGKAANGFGLHDMSGNVWEWTNDWHGTYSASPATNPTGPATGFNKIVRGGGYMNDPGFMRASARLAINPSNALFVFGFRVARNPD